MNAKVEEEVLKNNSCDICGNGHSKLMRAGRILRCVAGVLCKRKVKKDEYKYDRKQERRRKFSN